MLQEYAMSLFDVKAFGELIPSLYKSDIQSGAMHGVTVFDGETAPESLVGITLSRVTDKWQELIWVTTTAAYNTPEYGADLIRLRDEAAREAGELLGTFADIPADEEKLIACFSRAGFFLRSYDKDGHALVRATKSYEGKQKSDLLERFVGDNVKKEKAEHGKR